MFRASVSSSAEQDYTTAYGVLHWLCWSNSNLHTVHTAYGPAPQDHSQHNQCRTPNAVVHSLFLLKVGIMMPETCWDRSLIINIRLVSSCWFLSLHLVNSYFGLLIMIIIRHQLSLDDPVSASYNCLFKGLPSRLHPLSNISVILFLFLLVTCRSEFDLYLISFS